MTTALLPGPRIGWPLLSVPDEGGQLNWPTLEDSVRQSIQVILLTRPGEMLMHPEFGGGLQDFVHEENTLVTRRRIHERIVESLERWETRLELDRVLVAEDDDEPSHLTIEIAYRLRRTGAPQTVRASLQLGR
jgi:phage baseplate assembly protein W